MQLPIPSYRLCAIVSTRKSQKNLFLLVAQVGNLLADCESA